MIKFGTSGFRGILGDNFTKENVQKIAYAISQTLLESGKKTANICIGFDNRFMSKLYAEWICEVLAEIHNVKFFENSVPTPLIAWNAKNCDLGIMLTASHNPYYYNGVKIFKSGGLECDDELAKRIEEIANNIEYSKIKITSFKNVVESGKVVLTKEIDNYCESILKNVDIEFLKNHKQKVLVNVMHGSGLECIKNILDKLEYNYEIMNANLDPYFENKLPAPYVQNLISMSEKIVNEKFDLGFAFDGDADRFTFVGSSGEIFDCNYVSAVVYYYLTEIKGLKGDVVKNKALTNLLKLIAEESGNSVYEVKNGFKHVGKKLSTTNSLFGTETNGIAFKNHVMSKDGLMASMLVLDAVTHIGKSFEEILSDIYSKFNYKSVIREFAYPVSEQQRSDIINKLSNKKYPKFKDFEIDFVDDEEGYKIVYKNGYWGMVRFSGNEPVVRIFSEMKDLDECNEMIACYEDFLGVKERQ